MLYKVSVLALCMGLLCVALSGSESWSQSAGGVPSRLRLQSLGVGVAAPAATGDVAINGACTVAGSRCNTIANSGRVAAGYFTAAAGALQAGSVGVTSGSRVSAGLYSVNLTAAGFTQPPACSAIAYNSGVLISWNSNSAATTATVARFSFSTTGGAATDTDFRVICIGL